MRLVTPLVDRLEGVVRVKARDLLLASYSERNFVKALVVVGGDCGGFKWQRSK